MGHIIQSCNELLACIIRDYIDSIVHANVLQSLTSLPSAKVGWGGGGGGPCGGVGGSVVCKDIRGGGGPGVMLIGEGVEEGRDMRGKGADGGTG